MPDVANVAMAVTLLLGVPVIEAWLSWGALERALMLSMWIAAGGGVYVLALIVLGLRPRHLKIVENP